MWRKCVGVLGGVLGVVRRGGVLGSWRRKRRDGREGDGGRWLLG